MAIPSNPHFHPSTQREGYLEIISPKDPRATCSALHYIDPYVYIIFTFTSLFSCLHIVNESVAEVRQTSFSTPKL